MNVAPPDRVSKAAILARHPLARRRGERRPPHQESIRALAGRYGINPKTVAKWKRRTITADDAPMGPKAPSSTVLTVEEEAIIVGFRKHTLLPLDDCLDALQATIPHLTRSSLHRCLQRHGISRLPEIEGDKPNKKKFKAYPIGFFHIDIAEVRTEEGKLYLFVAIDRTSKIAFARLERVANELTATAFLEALIEAIPYKIHTVLTDNRIQFAYLPKNRNGPTAQYATHMFSLRCRQNGIEHRLTKPNHPWTNGQVERMNRTLKEATVKRYHYDSHDQLPNISPRSSSPTTSPNDTGDPARPDASRVCLKILESRARRLRKRSDPAHIGTIQLWAEEDACSLKDFGGVATRYDRHAANFPTPSASPQPPAT